MAYRKYSGSVNYRVAVLTSCLLLLLIIVITVRIDFNGNNVNVIDKEQVYGGYLETPTLKAVKAMCRPSDYRRTCVDAVIQAAGNVTDTRKLIEVAFEVAMKNVTDAGKWAAYLEEVQHDQRARKALRDCRELMTSARHALRRALDRMKGLDIARLEEELDDLRVWLSAASTYQDTCLDGFEGTTGDAGQKMRRILRISRRMTSNSLAIVTDLSTVLEPFDGARDHVRKLMEAAQLRPRVVVAKDGSGECKTIGEALSRIPRDSAEAVVVYVRSGVYHEAVEIGNSMTHVVLVGDGPHNTKITGTRNFVDGLPTFRTSSFAAKGDFFMAKNISFENKAGPAKHQAVALRVESDMSIFYNCIISGHQATLHAHTNRQFYRDCTIHGTVDLVFGNAAAVFQNCAFKIRQPLPDQRCTVTAQGRTDKRQPTGLVIQGSTILADGNEMVKTYLGRPRKEYARTVIVASYMDDVIDPQGWLPWDGALGIKTCEYAEVENSGPGAHTSGRVKWEGVRHVSMESAVELYSADRFIQGDEWVKDSGVPYDSGIFASPKHDS